MRKERIAKIRRDVGPGFTITKRIEICSVHFKVDDLNYLRVYDVQTARHHLKPTAVPSIFPWTANNFFHTSVTSRIAYSQQQRYNLKVPIDKFKSDNFNEIFINIAENADDDDNDDDFVYIEEVEDPTSKVLELQGKVAEMTMQLHELENKVTVTCFRYENIKRRDDLVEFYTGFPDHITLLAFYEEILEADAKVMRQWEGKRCKDSYDDMKCGCSYKLPLLEQFFLTLVRLCLGLLGL